MKCSFEESEDQDCSRTPDNSKEDTRWVANHNANDFNLDTFDAELYRAAEGKRPRIMFPPASSKDWEVLDDELDGLLENQTNWRSRVRIP